MGRLTVGVALLLAVGRTASGQDTASVPCAGQRIGAVVVRSSAPTAAAFRRIAILAALVSTIHVTTNTEVIRRFVLLHEGDFCDELRRAESERIIRAQPFIAEASVRVLPDSGGGVTLDVRTTDEISLVLGGAAHKGNPPLGFFRVGNSNIAGEGIYAAIDWRNGAPFRDGYGGRLVDNQLLGHPYILTTAGHVTPLGSDWLAETAHPFYTDIQRLAWRVRSGGTDDYVQFMNDLKSSHALRVVRNFFDVGGIVRVGLPGRLSLFGGSISGDNERPGDNQVLVTTKGFAADTTSQLLGRYKVHQIARLNALFGVRDLGFARVRGFDALTATQDMPVGFQLGTMLGRSVRMLGSRDDDVFMAGDMYVGAVGHNNALRFQVEAESRHSNSDRRWDGMLTNARAVEYFKPSRFNTTTASIEFSGGWRQRLPFNLTLSDREGGVRGFASSNTPGGQRLVGRLENRIFVGRPFNLADLGVGVFADAGRLWAGDIPYGITTPVRKSVGISVLGTVPPGSARLWRVDLAIATNHETGGHRFELRMSGVDKTTFFLPEPLDVQATRERTVPSSVFRWPQ